MDDRATDRMYECEVKKQFIRGGEKRWEWVKIAVLDAIKEGLQTTAARIAMVLKLHGRHVKHGPAPHVEHKSKQDFEYCPVGMYFRQNPEREPCLSLQPVE